MAAASGLPLVAPELRNPLHTTTYGTGELIRDALDQGVDEVSVALGGSATNDGGMGCMRALGARFLDSRGVELAGTGADLERVAHIDLSGLHPRARSTSFVAMCDVTNPLCGPDGATHTFGAQKGATPEMRERLEQGMAYRDVIIRELGVDPDAIRALGRPVAWVRRWPCSSTPSSGRASRLCSTSSASTSSWRAPCWW